MDNKVYCKNCKFWNLPPFNDRRVFIQDCDASSAKERQPNVTCSATRKHRATWTKDTAYGGNLYDYVEDEELKYPELEGILKENNIYYGNVHKYLNRNNDCPYYQRKWWKFWVE